MNTNKIRTKAVSGPGGIRCSCCNNCGSVKAARTIHNRIVRRKAKIALRNTNKQADNYDETLRPHVNSH